MYMGGESTQEISVSATQFCSDPKISLKNKMCLIPFLKEEGKSNFLYTYTIKPYLVSRNGPKMWLLTRPERKLISKPQY